MSSAIPTDALDVGGDQRFGGRFAGAKSVDDFRQALRDLAVWNMDGSAHSNGEAASKVEAETTPGSKR